MGVDCCLVCRSADQSSFAVAMGSRRSCRERKQFEMERIWLSASRGMDGAR